MKRAASVEEKVSTEKRAAGVPIVICGYWIAAGD